MKALIVLLLLAMFALALPAGAQSDQPPINFCASTLSYDLPEGWVADPPYHSPTGVSVRLASSMEALTRNTTELSQGQAAMTAAVSGRSTLAELLQIDADAN